MLLFIHQLTAASTYFTTLLTLLIPTSNVTGHHRGPKRKLRAGYRVPSLQRTFYLSLSSVMDVIFFIKCGIAHFLCAMHVFEVQAASSSPRIPLCQISFFCSLHWWASPWRKIVYSINHSITHPAYLMCREQKLLLQNKFYFLKILLPQMFSFIHSPEYASYSSACANIEQSNLVNWCLREMQHVSYTSKHAC